LSPSLDGLATEKPSLPASSATEPPPTSAHPSRARPLLAIVGMTLLLAGTLAVLWWVLEGARAGNEEDRFKQALERYEHADYAAARESLQKLISDFPTSRDARKYHFLAQLSGIRDEAYSAREPAELKTALDHVLQFLGLSSNDPLLKDRHPDAWLTLRRMAERLAAQAEQQHDAEALGLARKAWTEADKFQPPGNVNAPEVHQKLTKEFERVKQGLAAHAQREAVLDAIRKHIAHASAAGVQESRALVAAAGLKDDAEAAGLLADLVDAHRAAVKYEPAPDENESAADAVDEDSLPSLLATPALIEGKTGMSRGGVALALARGVLYAFDPDRGGLRWARRVGIDTSVLPLHVPADPITPELLLVLSSDNKSVSAIVAETGAVVWRRALSQPCLGQPVLVGRSLLVPTLAGWVEEIEISGGRRLGHYPLGQRLTVGGARQEGTTRVYFPGDEFCVYVLDVARRSCEALLYTDHPAGSLRGPPILLPDGKTPTKAGSGQGPSGWMLLCQAKGTDAVEVRAFELPITGPDQPAAGPTLKIPGMSWFAPWHDAEKLAIATDAGVLSLWGIRQKGNRDDPLLFSLLGEDYHLPGGAGLDRPQVVHAGPQGYWVVAGGRLHRLDAVFRPQSGAGLVPAWPEPPMLGSPLHAAQYHRDSAGRPVLLMTTLAADRPSCLCTAVDAASGQFHWQRQLGCVSIHPPVVAQSQVLLRDPTGLLLLDPVRFPDSAGERWQPAGDFLIKDPLGQDDRVMVLPGTDEFVQLSWRNAGTSKLRVRHIPLTGEGTSQLHELPGVPAGNAALGDGFLVLPLADGVAVRLDLRGSGSGAVVAGPNWRAPGADDHAPGYAALLGRDDFLLTDGSRGLARVHWPSPKVQESRAKAELSHRIVAPPAVVPAAAGSPPRVCVADASDTLTLLDGERLQVIRRWTLGGKITAGPFVRGTGLLCVVEHKRLAWIDPDRDEPKWEYALVAAVVGATPLVEGMLIAADVSGRFLALDPQTGSPLGPGYTLKANVAPDAAPVPFGPGRLLVPLNDGTQLLLPLQKLKAAE
jgi:hypothetical protein